MKKLSWQRNLLVLLYSSLLFPDFTRSVLFFSQTLQGLRLPSFVVSCHCQFLKAKCGSPNLRSFLFKKLQIEAFSNVASVES